MGKKDNFNNNKYYYRSVATLRALRGGSAHFYIFLTIFLLLFLIGKQVKNTATVRF